MLFALTGCASQHDQGAATDPSTLVPSPVVSGLPGPDAPTARLPEPTRPRARALDATAACVQFAQAAADVDTATSTLGQARQAAARAYGTPQLQALYDGAGEGRNREQETWQQHHARVTVTAVPDADPLDELDGDPSGDSPGTDPGAEALPPGTPVAVTVTGTARGTDGWTAPTVPYRLDCLTLQDPVAGWRVDDVAVSTFLPAAG